MAVLEAAHNGSAHKSEWPKNLELQQTESAEVDSGKRRMPESLNRYLVKVQGGRCYLPAAYRIVWFRDECPDWGVQTEIVEGGEEAGFATVKAIVCNAEGRIIATGHKTESRKDFPAGHVEKAETGAVARALALAGFGTQFSPELDEGGMADSPQRLGGVRFQRTRTQEAESDIWEGPGQCPKCHAPAGKRHVRPCA